jgi:hypothetical protein
MSACGSLVRGIRREAVAIVRSGRKVSEVAAALGMTEQSLRTWVEQERDLLKRAAAFFAAETDRR